MFAKLGLLTKFNIVQATVENLHPGRTAEILLNGEGIGFIGQVHPTVQKELDLKDTYVFELSLKAVLEAEGTGITNMKRIPRFPSITRDIALVVDKETVSGAFKRNYSYRGGKLIKRSSCV